MKCQLLTRGRRILLGLSMQRVGTFTDPGFMIEVVGECHTGQSARQIGPMIPRRSARGELVAVLRSETGGRAGSGETPRREYFRNLCRIPACSNDYPSKPHIP